VTRRNVWITIGAVVVIAIVAIGIWQSRKPEGKVIKIGAILPLTGDLAFFGNPEKELLLMAVDEVNRSGGIDGKRVQLIIEDSKGSARDGVTAVQKVLLNKPVAVITSLTIVSNATQPILTSHKVVQIALSVHPSIARQSEYTLRPYYGFEDEMKVIAGYLAQKRCKKVAVLWIMVPECETAINQILVPELKKQGAKLVASESYGFGEHNLRPQLAKIATKDPDAIITMDFGNMMGVILKEARNLRILDKLVGGIGLFLSPPIEASLLEGLPVAGPAFIIRNTEEFQKFSRDFYQRTRQRPSYDVLYTYDAFRLLMEGIRRGGTSPEAIVKAITSMKEFDGLTGKMVIQPDRNVTVQIEMGVYHNGKIRPLDFSTSK
jgi:branched-chain amino acid transport system substrate-binding protein